VAVRILILEDNLFWSARLEKTLAALGHEPTTTANPDARSEGFQVAIVNLGCEKFHLGTLVPRLKKGGAYVIGHAGHKEAELREEGANAGCDHIATNSELTFRLGDLLERAADRLRGEAPDQGREQT
jgi:hypothetical protein